MNVQQIAYAAADRIPGRETAGWGITYRSGVTDPSVERELEEGVTLSLPVSMPDFPTVEQLATRPVRLRYRYDARMDMGLFWRSIEAGKDHTNRPGNVFTHAAAVRPLKPSLPTDFAASPDWLEPFRPEQVRSAAPGDELRPSSIDAIGRLFAWFESATGSSARASVPWLVDTVMDQLGRDTGVGFKVESWGDALAWITFVELLLPPDLTRHLSFSTWEDFHSLQAFTAGRVTLVGVTDENLLTDPPSGLRILDPSWAVTPSSESRGRWQLPDGSSAPETKWSEAATDLIWLDSASARQVLEARNELYGPLVLILHNAMKAASLALQLGLLATPDAVVVDRDVALRSILNPDVLPLSARSLPLVSGLVQEAGLLGADQYPSGETEPESAPSDAPIEVDLSKIPPLPPGRTGPSASGLQQGAQQGAISRSRVAYSPDEVLCHEVAPREEDPLDEYPFPTPASAMAAATHLAADGRLDIVRNPQLGLTEYRSLSGPGLLAALYLAALDDEVIVSDQDLGALHQHLTEHDQVERALPALLMLALRADLVAIVSPHRRAGDAWWNALVWFVAHLDRVDLGFVAFHAHPWVRRFMWRPTATAAFDSQVTQFARFLNSSGRELPAMSSWTLRLRDGSDVASCIRDAIAPRSTMTPSDDGVMRSTDRSSTWPS